MVERRRVGRLTVKSNQIAVCDPFGLGFGFQTLARKVPRGRFPVEVSLAHVRKGPRKGAQLVAALRVRLGAGEATGYRQAELDAQREPPRRWLGATFSGYAAESGYGCFACGGAAASLDEACRVAFEAGELDPQLTRLLREQLSRPDRAGWGTGELIPVLREGSIVACSAGHGEGYYPSYWGYDDQRRLVSLVTDFFVLPTRTELFRESWAGRSWRELVYQGDRGQRFWRVKVDGSTRTIEHGVLGHPGQASRKEFGNSGSALEAAAKRIQKQIDAGYFELSASASTLRHTKSQRIERARGGFDLSAAASSSLAIAARTAFSEPKAAWQKASAERAAAKEEEAKEEVEQEAEPKRARGDKKRPKRTSTAARASAAPEVKPKRRSTATRAGASAEPKPRRKSTAARASSAAEPKRKSTAARASAAAAAEPKRKSTAARASAAAEPKPKRKSSATRASAAAEPKPKRQSTATRVVAEPKAKRKSTGARARVVAEPKPKRKSTGARASVVAEPKPKRKSTAARASVIAEPKPKPKSTATRASTKATSKRGQGAKRIVAPKARTKSAWRR